jgi:hypothetical protein
MKKIIFICLIVFLGILTQAIFYPNHDCNEKCVARHLMIAASNAQTEINNSIRNKVAIHEKTITDTFVDSGYINKTGEITVTNIAKKINITYTPIYLGIDVVWKCSITPAELKIIFANENCNSSGL